MNKTITLVLLAVLFVANLLALAPRTFGLGSDVFGQLNLLVDVRHEIVSNYVTEPNEKDLIRSGVRGMIDALNDPYTAYLTPEDLEAFDRDTTGSFSGIGAEITIDQALMRLKIVTPLEDSPAWNAGVMAGDIVMMIDDTDTLKLPIDKAVDKLIGPAGTKVTIKVRHDSGDEETITITRDKNNIQTVRGVRRDANKHWDFWLDESAKIGYVRLTQFSEPTSRDLRAAVQKLVEGGAKGMILDLRFNGGGLLDSAIEVSDTFLAPDKVVVSVKGRSVKEQVYRSREPDLSGGMDIVLVANEYSASASEIVTGALSDNERAKFVGTRTFGKGSVQQLKLLDNNMGALKMTNAFYYIPSGRKIHKIPGSKDWGVTPPDGYYVDMTPKELETMQKVRREGDILRRNDANNGRHDHLTPEWITEHMADPQLAAAFKTLKNKIETNAWIEIGGKGDDEMARKTKMENLERQRELIQERLVEIEKELKKLESGETEVNDSVTQTPAELKDAKVEIVPKAPEAAEGSIDTPATNKEATPEPATP